jgi:small ligand-binding sensory domain FIST
MLQAADGLSQLGDTDQATSDVAEQLVAGLGGRPPKAVVFFATTRHGPAYARIGRHLRSRTGAEHVVGCSAAGVLGLGREVEGAPGLAALALAGEIEAKRFFIPSLRGRSEEIGRELGRMALTVGREPRSIVLLADTYNLAPDELLAGLKVVSPETRLVGGGASEDGSIGETSVVAHEAASSNAIAGLLLGGVRVRVMVTQACMPVGAWRTITAAQSNRILELDGKPALPEFLAALPEALRQDVRQALRSTLAALAVPVDPDEIAPGYVVRYMLGADPAGQALLVGDEVVPGMRFAIAIRDPAAARASLDESLARFAAAGVPIAALYFNCVARGEAFYGFPGIDSAYIQRSLGDTKLAGMFCGAEFAPLGGTNRLHQFSGVLVGFETDGPSEGHI